MSEFSESFHLYSSEQSDGIRLLKASWLKGFVYPAANGWVTILPAGSKFQPNKRLIANNKGLLVHYIFAEDHGWAISVYEGTQMTCHYACRWEDDIEINQTDLDRNKLIEIINNNQYLANKVTPLQVTQLLYPNDIEEIFEKVPAKQLAELMGLHHYDWNSYDYLLSVWGEEKAGGITYIKGFFAF